MDDKPEFSAHRLNDPQRPAEEQAACRDPEASTLPGVEIRPYSLGRFTVEVEAGRYNLDNGS